MAAMRACRFGQRGVLVLVLGVLGLAPLAQAGVGDAPTMDFKRCQHYLDPCSEPIVIAAEERFVRVELVGMSWKHGFCNELDYIPFANESQGTQVCGRESPLPDEGDAIRIESLGRYHFDHGRGPRATDIDGALSPEVDHVVASFNRNHKPQKQRALVAQVNGDLQQDLEQPDPFGYFVLTVRGKPPWGTFRFIAYDSGGAVLDKINMCGGGFTPPCPY
jgi:hypothetical protein